MSLIREIDNFFSFEGLKVMSVMALSVTAASFLYLNSIDNNFFKRLVPSFEFVKNDRVVLENNTVSDVFDNELFERAYMSMINQGGFVGTLEHKLFGDFSKEVFFNEDNVFGLVCDDMIYNFDEEWLMVRGENLFLNQSDFDGLNRRYIESNAVDFDSRWKLKHVKKVMQEERDFIYRSCNVFGVDEAIVYGIFGVEGGGMNVVSPTGRRGYGQIYEGSIKTALKYASRDEFEGSLLHAKAIEYFRASSEDREVIVDDILRNDEKLNLQVGIAYLSYLNSMFGDWSLSVAAYHVGENQLAKVLHWHKGLKTGEWSEDRFFELRRDKRGRLFAQVDTSNMRSYLVQNSITVKTLVEDAVFMGVYERKIRRSVWEKFPEYTGQVFKCALDSLELL